MAKKKTEEQLGQVFTQLILNILTQSKDLPLNYKQICSKLNLTDTDSREAIQQILSSQVENGNLEETEKGKFKIKSSAAYVTGIIAMASTGSAFLVSKDLEQDIYIAPRKLRNALHGDKVKLFVYAKQNGKQKEGEVVEILERAKMEFTGIIKMSLSKRFAFLMPDSRKMLHDIFIPIESLKGAKDGEKALARITEWPQGAKNPIGEVVNVLGKQGENNTEMNAILAEYGFPLEFPPTVLKESAEISTIITPDDISSRRDFRKILTFTIDPHDAKDFDDAISYKILDNGNVEVGVHIADVSHYVKPATALELEAFERGTSVYLVDRVIPMLPERLSNELCSLKPHEDKLCFSAVFELTPTAQIVHEWYGKTIIHSNRRFAYEEVQDILDAGQGELFTELNALNKLAYQLRKERFAAGAINFESIYHGEFFNIEAMLEVPGSSEMPVLVAALAVRLLQKQQIDQMTSQPAGPVWLLPLRDSISLAVWAGSYFVRNIEWRGMQHRLGAGGALLEGRLT